MGLNINNEETDRRARELARLTGESMSAAVNEAIRKRLERVRGKSNDEMLKRIMMIAEECGPRWKQPYRSTEHGDLPYDEKGLPK